LVNKEAMKLALEWANKHGEIVFAGGGMAAVEGMNNWMLALREALAEQQLSEPCRCGKQTNAWCMANTCSKAQQALEKKAENARELGLDYEPVWGGGFTNKDYEDAMRQRRLHQLTSPPAQRTWVGLTDEDYRELHLEMGPTYFYQDYGRAIEAKLKERNQ